MCGIAGILDFNANTYSLPERLKKMSDTLQHRGPDDEGFVFFQDNKVFPCGADQTQASAWNNAFAYAPKQHITVFQHETFLGFAHRRLSIIDLSSAAHQPMCNEDQSIWITCNGEIYNYIELRDELQQHGFVFSTQSDIEVLLKAYQHWGLRFLDKLNGMWALVIYDRKENCLIGCRDRFGVKPFYYYHQDNVLAFASEQKALHTLPYNTDQDAQAVYQYLVHSQVETHEQGMYQHIKELMPSHYFIYDLNSQQFQVNRYYKLSVNGGAERFYPAKAQEYVEETRERIRDAVSLRLRSDVPIGFCLSGGIDSSSIIGMANVINSTQHLEHLQGNLHAFTATHPQHGCDESQWAQQVVDKNHLIWHTVPCSSQQMMLELEDIIYFQDAPLFSTSTYAQNAVMKLAKQEGITILLDGQGGDELFAGYVPFYIAYYFELMRAFRLGDLASQWGNLKHSPLGVSILMKSIGKVALNELLPASAKQFLYKNIHKETMFIQKEAWQQHASGISLANDYSARKMNYVLSDFFTQHYLKNLLRWEDRCSMQYGIESRTPFADDVDLIEYVFSIPADYKIHKGWSKYLLREAMRDVLPAAIYNRTDKLGFATPQTAWLMAENAMMKSKIGDLQSLDTERMVDAKKLLDNWQRIFSSSAHRASQDFAWRYMNYLLWRKVNLR